MGIVILFQLFNLQIVNGAEYRNTSNTRLTREATIEAARGSILDRSGNVLVSTEMEFALEMYKSKTDDKQLNSSILLMTNILRNNGDSYVDTFPISIDPFEFHFNSEEELAEWKSKYKIPEEASAEEAFYLFRDKYGITSDDVNEIRQILAIRYAITTIGYSTTKSMQISSRISRNSAVQLQENSQNLTGINIVVEPIRIYHTGSLASHILGYLGRISESNQKEFEALGDSYDYKNTDKVGQTGIEKVFEQYLRGTDGVKQIDMSVDGTVTGEYISQEAIGGSNVVLTIDANLQQVAEDALERNVMKIREGGFGKAFPAEGGAVVVTNVNTGEILAMASYPDYEPELFYKGITQAKLNEYNDPASLKPIYNRATQGTYSPGSTFKMVTAIAGLESGAIGIADRVNDIGVYTVSNNPKENPHCWYYNSYGRGHGPLNVVGALQKSCNYYFYEVSNRMGIETLADYAYYFGLGKNTGIELPEAKGTVARRELDPNWSAGLTAMAAIGQSANDFTPVQMSKYISMVANGGHPIDLSIVKSVINSDGTLISQNELDEYTSKMLKIENTPTEDKNISSETIAAVHEGMRRVAEDEGGTAYTIFKDFEIEIGGKTGSAEIGGSSKDENRVIAWFAGFAPFENPEISIVVMVEKGGHGYYTAEVVRDIMQEYFRMNMEAITENMSATTETESFR